MEPGQPVQKVVAPAELQKEATSMLSQPNVRVINLLLKVTEVGEQRFLLIPSSMTAQEMRERDIALMQGTANIQDASQRQAAAENQRLNAEWQKRMDEFEETIEKDKRENAQLQARIVELLAQQQLKEETHRAALMAANNAAAQIQLQCNSQIAQLKASMRKQVGTQITALSQINRINPYRGGGLRRDGLEAHIVSVNAKLNGIQNNLAVVQNSLN